MTHIKHIDTAQATEWYNEAAIAQSVDECGMPREKLFLVTKVHPRYFGYERTLRSFNHSLAALRTSYVDLLLLHTSDCSDWTGLCEKDSSRGTFFDAWRALESLYHKGQVKAIGVSNFNVEQLEALSSTAVVPIHVVQNHMDPFKQDREVRAWCQARGVLYTGYSTLGTQWRPPGGQNPVLNHPVIQTLAQRHGVSPALLVLVWARQEGVAVIPRSSEAKHIDELARLLPKAKDRVQVVLSEDEMKQMQALDGVDGSNLRDEL